MITVPPMCCCNTFHSQRMTLPNLISKFSGAPYCHPIKHLQSRQQIQPSVSLRTQFPILQHPLPATALHPTRPSALHHQSLLLI